MTDTQPVANTQQLKDRFIKEYGELCKKFGFQLFAYPKMLRDQNGFWITVIQYGVDEYKEKKVEPASSSTESKVEGKPLETS